MLSASPTLASFSVAAYYDACACAFTVRTLSSSGQASIRTVSINGAAVMVDALIASKAERIALLLQRRPLQLRRQGFPAMVKALLADW